METTLLDIDSVAKKFADAHSELAQIMTELDDAVEAVKRAKLAVIKTAAAKAAHRYGELEALIDGSRHLFVKPKTMVLHGIKLGLQKGKGKISFEDPELVVKLIKKLFPDQTDQLINTKETPRKEGIQTLTVAELKRLGCEVEEAGDNVVIKCIDSDVDKMVNALIRESIAEAA